jgi:hypothetical protein
MDELISPKYQMKLVKLVHDAICQEYKTYEEVKLYIKKWHRSDNYGNWENFEIVNMESKEIDLLHTLHNISGTDLLKIAIDLSVETPDFIPSIPIFRNELKSSYKTSYDTFTKAFKQIETDPSVAVGLANSALESIIKEILKDDRISSKVTGNETLYKLTSIILKEFNFTSDQHPKEIKTIGSSLLAINQAIEKLRSEMTDFHGKTDGDYLIRDTVYTYFVVNTVATGLFIISYYKTKYPKPFVKPDDSLPF